jgi:hypothetical protein
MRITWRKLRVDASETGMSDSSEDLTGSEMDTGDSDIVIEQKNAKGLTRCVIVDKLDGCIKRCENSDSFRKLWQLCGVWQVDGDGISEADGILERLGVCNYHFNHDQNNLHDPGFKRKKDTSQSMLRRRCLYCGKLFYFFTRGSGCEKHSRKIVERNVQVACNGQFNCNALEPCDSICERAFDKIESPRYICCNCYEREGGHLHIKSGSGRQAQSCTTKGYHQKEPRVVSTMAFSCCKK